MSKKSRSKDWESLVNLLAVTVIVFGLLSAMPVVRLYLVNSWWKTALAFWFWTMIVVGAIILWNKFRVDTPRDAAYNLKRLAFIMGAVAFISITFSAAIGANSQKAIATEHPAPAVMPAKATAL